MLLGSTISNSEIFDKPITGMIFSNSIYTVEPKMSLVKKSWELR